MQAKRKIIGIILIIALALSLTGCKKTPLVEQVEEYDKVATEGGITYWDVYFEEGCDTSDYDYTDFLDIIVHCIESSSTASVDIVAFDSDNMTRFAWNSFVPQNITQYDGNAPYIHTSDWQLTAEDYKKISEAEK